MTFGKLRIAWSVFCGIACVLLIVLWVRVYRNDRNAWTIGDSIAAERKLLASRLQEQSQFASQKRPHLNLGFMAFHIGLSWRAFP
jgi:hypothetical protein